MTVKEKSVEHMIKQTRFECGESMITGHVDVLTVCKQVCVSLAMGVPRIVKLWLCALYCKQA